MTKQKVEKTLEDKQADKIRDLLLSEQDRLGLAQYQMAIRLDMPLSQYNRLIRAQSGNIGYSMKTLNKIFENTKITCQDVFG